jgi:hypothetical protein
MPAQLLIAISPTDVPPLDAADVVAENDSRENLSGIRRINRWVPGSLSQGVR